MHPLSTSNHNGNYRYVSGAKVVLHPLSTSNHNIQTDQNVLHVLYCILFLHQTTTFTAFRIKSTSVVLHPLSTSNHNGGDISVQISTVVLHPLSTSNHNFPNTHRHKDRLYCILFLHQTTTITISLFPASPLYCILFLHQTTTKVHRFPDRS